MEHSLVGVTPPTFPVCGIGAEHVIVGQEVLIPEVLGGLSVVSEAFGSVPISVCGKVTPTCTLNLLSEVPQGYTKV